MRSVINKRNNMRTIWQDSKMQLKFHEGKTIRGRVMEKSKKKRVIITLQYR